MNKTKSKPYGNLIDQTFFSFNKALINNNPQRKTQTNKDQHCQTENDESPGAEHSIENDLEDTETTKTLVISNLVPKLLKDGTAEGIIPLYS